MDVEREMCRGGKDDLKMLNACLESRNNLLSVFPGYFSAFSVCLCVFFAKQNVSHDGPLLLYFLLITFFLGSLYFDFMEYIMVICDSLLTMSCDTAHLWLRKAASPFGVLLV